MKQDELEWVREIFASGKATRLRLATGHTIYDCGAAAGISGEAWWKLENGQSITAHRAPILATVLRRMRSGERLEAAAGDGETPVEEMGANPEQRARAAERDRREHELLLAAMDFLSLTSAELVASAPEWDSEQKREMRGALRRLLRRRMTELGVEPPNERLS